MTQTALTEPLPSVLGNHGQLQQVILNLIRNAADAMASVSDRPWVLRMKSTVEDPDSVLVTVEDSGTGIDSRDINRIFQAFFTTKANGMGMGLPIYRTIIEAHGGRLSVSSGVDHGAVFIIHLPAVVAEIGKNRVGEKG